MDNLWSVPAEDDNLHQAPRIARHGKEAPAVRILLLHGWLLERSGSNVYTASLAYQWAAAGHEVHLFCQERHPNRYPFIYRSRVYELDGRITESTHEVPEIAGSCFLHRPELGEMLPVFNLDEYEGFTVVKRFAEMSKDEVDQYLDTNVNALRLLVKEFPVDVAFANHVLPNPSILARLKEETGIPFVVFPHGSAIEYAVKKQDFLKDMVREAIDSSDRLIVGNQVVTERIWNLYPERVKDWSHKHSIVSVGVDTNLFQPVDVRSRQESSDALLALPNPGDGKRQEQVRELCQKARAIENDEQLLQLVDGARGSYHYTSPDADLSETLSRIDWQKDSILLYVGKLIAGKGVHDLIVALPELLHRRPDLRLILVGESTFRETLELLLFALSEGLGDLVDRILRLGWALDQRAALPLKAAQTYVERVGMETLLEWGRESRPIDKVVFAGYLNHARFSKLLPCADVSIFPSEIAEAYPLVLVESICAGVTPMGAYFEGLKDGVDSISEGLPEEIREAMRLHVSPAQKVRDIVKKVPVLLDASPQLKPGWQSRAQSYSWTNVAERLLYCMELVANPVSN